MTFRSALVHLLDGTSSAAVLAATKSLASRFPLTIAGLHVREPIVQSYIGFGEIPAELFEQWRATLEQEAAGAVAAFAASGLAGSARIVEGETVAALARSSRSADLVIIGQTDPNTTRASRSDVPDDLVFALAAPLLVIPYIGAAPTFGSAITIAWNDTREAFRAVREALPLLAAAKSVHVVSIDDGDHPVAGVAELIAWLATHNIGATPKRVVTTDGDVGGMLLSTIADLGSDLIVMGAYGHSRLREFILGGATRDILRQMTVPVLLAH